MKTFIFLYLVVTVLNDCAMFQRVSSSDGREIAQWNKISWNNQIFRFKNLSTKDILKKNEGNTTIVINKDQIFID